MSFLDSLMTSLLERLVLTCFCRHQMAEIVGYLDKTLRSDAILTNGAGNYSGFLHRFYKYAHTPRSLGTPETSSKV